MLYGNQRWPEIVASDVERPVVIVPLAALEQHGHHLPLLTDTHLVTAIAAAVHERLEDDVLLLPTLWLGASDHHLDFPGTVSVPNEVYAEMIQGLVISLVNAGYKRILLLNGHGGNVAPGEAAITQTADEVDECNEAWIVLASYWTVAEQALAAEKHGMTQPSLSHACEYETSLMLHLHKDLVSMRHARGSSYEKPAVPKGVRVAGRFNAISDTGALGRPELATAEKGASLLRAIVDEVEGLVAAMLEWPEREIVGPTDVE